jgi:hypothetical protein
MRSCQHNQPPSKYTAWTSRLCILVGYKGVFAKLHFLLQAIVVSRTCFGVCLLLNHLPVVSTHESQVVMARRSSQGEWTEQC